MPARRNFSACSSHAPRLSSSLGLSSPQGALRHRTTARPGALVAKVVEPIYWRLGYAAAVAALQQFDVCACQNYDRIRPSKSGILIESQAQPANQNKRLDKDPRYLIRVFRPFSTRPAEAALKTLSFTELA